MFNSTYKKFAVQWLNEALCYGSSFVVADSFRRRNRQLLEAANVTTNAKKDRRHFKTMTKNGLDIQTISTKRTDFQTDLVLLLGQVTAKKEKANPSHFLKFLFADPHCTHLVLPASQADPSQNQKSAIFADPLMTIIS